MVEFEGLDKIEAAVEEVLKKRPEFIITALKEQPQILEKVISYLIPWRDIATKEDIKMLVELMNKRFEDLFHYIDKRFEDLLHYMDKRFEAIEKRFEDLLHHMNKRFEAIDKRLAFIEKIIILLLGCNLISIATLITFLVIK
jgi:hypothetical protein